MRIVYMGTPEFAVTPLRALMSEHEVVAVFTAPASAAGRGRKLIQPPVADKARSLGLELQQPPTLEDRVVQETLRAYRPDVIAVAAYGRMLPPKALATPRHGCVNVHPSLLPRHRGAAPIERAILAGDRVTGVSIMLMDEGFDTGPVGLRIEVPVGDMDAATLSDALSALGADALLEGLRRLDAGTMLWTPQREQDATYAAKVTAADVAIAPVVPVEEALRRVRASSPRAPTRAAVAGRTVTVLRAEAAGAAVGAGRVAADDGLVLGLADGAIVVSRLIPAGRAAMSGSDFVRGAHLGPESVWEAAA